MKQHVVYISLATTLNPPAAHPTLWAHLKTNKLNNFATWEPAELSPRLDTDHKKMKKNMIKSRLGCWRNRRSAVRGGRIWLFREPLLSLTRESRPSLLVLIDWLYWEWNEFAMAAFTRRKQVAVEMSRFLTRTASSANNAAPNLIKRWRLTFVHWRVMSFSTHPQHKSSSLGQPVTVHYSVQMRCLHVYALYMYLQHTLGLERDTGVSLDQDTSLYSLYFCSNVTICRNQSSSRLRLNKYIFTVKLNPKTDPPSPPLPTDPPEEELSCFAIPLDMCIAVCVCVQSPY